jgi:DNA adenine methylase
MSTSRLLVRPNAPILSPLRYPGAKRRLAGYVRRVLELNGRTPGLFVEPFAGGASVALQLLQDGVVSKIGLVDRDPLVAAFWKTVFFDADWLCARIADVEISLTQWKRMRALRTGSVRDQALACLFLNRTSYSGILASTAGPLGGWGQTSAYDLGCRFPRETLTKRVRQAADLADRVAFVWSMSYKRAFTLLERGRTYPDRFYYIDPPFFKKAERLYRFAFTSRDHRVLRDRLVALRTPWLLSYDSLGDVEDLYGSLTQRPAQVELLYSASSARGLSIAREVILSNLPDLPHEDVLWRSASEWRRARTRVQAGQHAPTDVRPIPKATSAGASRPSPRLRAAAP